MKKTVTYLGIGGNLGVRELFLAKTREWIELKVGEITAESKIYETAAWGMENAPDFLNQVVEVETDLSAEEVLEVIRRVEKLLGRIRKEGEGFQSRTADIDILIFGDEVIDTADLKVPHPGIPKRRFVLTPLCDIAPDRIHPTKNTTLQSLLDTTTDDEEVREWISPIAT